MATWNYRVVKRTTEHETFYAIYEVYYDEEGNVIACTVNPVPCFGEDLSELEAAHVLMAEAFSKPTLNYDDIGNEH